MPFLRLLFLLWLAVYLVRLLRRFLQATAVMRERQRVPPMAAPPRQKTPYEILEVRPGASSVEVRRAYQRMVSQYHPDQVAHLGAELREVAEKRTKEITAAYNVLKDKGRP